MSTQHSAPLGPGPPPVATVPTAADRAYRRAWWCIALDPVSIVAAFVVGEGLFSWVTDTGETGDPAFWQVLVAGTPALLVLVLPGIFAVREGRMAMAAGQADGRVPAWVGAGIGIGFVVLNLGQYLLGVLID